ncbi:hypothetical protein CROQUDRAFT_99783 [Cronartium quercuum f. sp. fusiforme G11]|uniref:Uncharacterized protein n=1 Tax=Cronartium quercuum f. sp. fusiforme G11 TaxID=708437 RepID=A0A9P6T6L2_9BASI|nr:hypothetical protein CROQUDRAFT_99783 [Cronartium quercuum f. sp. fusiforme G11]
MPLSSSLTLLSDNESEVLNLSSFNSALYQPGSGSEGYTPSDSSNEQGWQLSLLTQFQIDNLADMQNTLDNHYNHPQQHQDDQGQSGQQLAQMIRIEDNQQQVGVSAI